MLATFLVFQCCLLPLTAEVSAMVVSDDEWQTSEPFRIGIIFDNVTTDYGSTLLVTNEKVMSVFDDAVSERNRRQVTILSRRGISIPSKNSTIKLAATLVQFDRSAGQMLDILNQPKEKSKGRLIAIVDTARCVASKCKELTVLVEQILPDVLLHSPCCYVQGRQARSNESVGKTGHFIYNGIQPHHVVDVALQLAGMYNWRRFNFVVSPDSSMLDAFVEEAFEYLKTRDKSNVILQKTFYCSQKLAAMALCNRQNQARRIIHHEATVTFLLLESPTDMTDFVKRSIEEIDTIYTEGKAFVYVSLTGMLAPIFMLEEFQFTKDPPEGLLFLRRKKAAFNNFRNFSSFGMTRSDIASQLFADLRVLSKATEVYAQSKRLFRSLSHVFCGSKFAFSESPETIIEYSGDCTHEISSAELWSAKPSDRSGLYVEKVYELDSWGNMTATGAPYWLGSGSVAPVEKNTTTVGWCSVPFEVVLPSSVAGSATLVVATLLTGCCFFRISRKRRRRKQDIIASVIANFSELTFKKHEEQNERESGVTSRVSAVESSGTPDTEVLKVGLRVEARWHGKHVFVSEQAKPTCIVDDALLQDIVQVKSLCHPNINALVGVVPDAFHVCTLHEYCAKGTLAQVIARKTLQLNQLFKISFLNDIAAGMAYLQQSVIHSHGELTSENVLVDARWFCKISDIPLLAMRKNAADESIANNRNSRYHYKNTSTFMSASHVTQPPEGTYWTAPELLRLTSRPVCGSQKGDVYSYGIIIFEVATRKRPYFFDDLPEKDVLMKVRKASCPAFRPSCLRNLIPEDAFKLLELASDCWEEVAAFRPTFPGILRTLQKMNKNKDVSAKLVDEMIATMEHYAETLEATVNARTRELVEEERRSEDLLSKMLPRSIIEELKCGRIVHPGSFESVTVYFSDIVGFTKLAAESTGLEVVALLNDLYSEFDNVIDLYNVYKVETIGDAYMVASGLPIRNNTHASEIATMALDIMSRVTTFQIRHRPGKVLQLRIGIHSGSAVAGIVGLTMPRYCLFGDTINYASRMESSGLALRIHVSPESKTLLDSVGGFILENRGYVKMKGKGIIETYHLIGKRGFTRPLPDLSLAASLEEHEFK